MNWSRKPRRGANKMSVAGLGPHGERAATPTMVTLPAEDIEAARQRRFSVAVVTHTASSDWSRQHMAGLSSTLGFSGTIVSEVVDCEFDAAAQVAALERLKDSTVDAIISIPIGNSTVAEAHRSISQSGKCLVLNESVPTGLVPPNDYRCLVSSDNFGLGFIGAELLSPHVRSNAQIGLLAYGVDFYATNEREIAFRRWMKAKRADVTVRTERFESLDNVAVATRAMLRQTPQLHGLFVVWDTPARIAAEVLSAEGVNIPLTTVDLSRETAIELASGQTVMGIAAQQPYNQGVAAASAVILALLERSIPSWIALPGLSVTRENLIESYQRVWSSAAPPEVLSAMAS